MTWMCFRLTDSKNYCLFDREYSDIHAIMIYDNKFIHVCEQVQILGFDVVTEIGKVI